jgi:ABC-type phosphate transport system substrate-binding protein
LIYALQNKVQFGAVKNKEGVYVLGSLKSVTAAAAALGKNSIPEDLRFTLTDAPGKDSYPLCGTTWALVYVNQTADKGPVVREFLRWATHEGQELCETLYYGRLPEALVRRAEGSLTRIKTGNE